MRRAGRWLLNGVTVLLAVLALAAAVESVRSIWWADAVLWMSGDRRSAAFAVGERGALSYMWLSATDEGHVYLKGAAGAGVHWVSDPADHYYPKLSGFGHVPRFAGFAWAARRVAGLRAYSITLPLPFVALLLAAPGGARLLRRLRRCTPGLCPCCGYDLTGNVSGVCPECGASIAMGR